MSNVRKEESHGISVSNFVNEKKTEMRNEMGQAQTWENYSNETKSMGWWTQIALQSNVLRVLSD